MGPYALTPQLLFTLLVVSLDSLDFDRLPLKTPAATFPSNLRTCSPRFAKEGRTKKPYHILAPPRYSATSHPSAGHPDRSGPTFPSRRFLARQVFLHSVIPTGANRLFLPRGFCAPVRGVEGSWQDRGWLRCRFCVRLLYWRMPGSWSFSSLCESLRSQRWRLPRPGRGVIFLSPACPERFSRRVTSVLASFSLPPKLSPVNCELSPRYRSSSLRSLVADRRSLVTFPPTTASSGWPKTNSSG